MTEELRELLLSDDHEDNLLGVNIMRAKNMNVEYWLKKIANRYWEETDQLDVFYKYFNYIGYRQPVLKDEFTNN